MPIYTRTGDKGKTSLFDGTRVLKSHERVETYGTIDELNSTLGVVIAEMKSSYSSSESGAAGESRSKSARLARTIRLQQELEKIQHDLLDIGSALATPYPLPVIGLEKRSQDFEGLIDDMTAKMPEIRYFILPGGGQVGSLLHVARTITRRAERQLVRLSQQEEVDETIIKFVNRLSDLLFTMARFVNHLEKKKEIKWVKK